MPAATLEIRKTATPPATPPVLEILPPVKRPKGYENLVELVKDHAADVAFKALEAWERGYELGRSIVEFAERKDVASEVAKINKERKEAKKGGRPLSEHCFVAGMLEQDTGLSKAWLEKCARAFLRDRESGFALGKKLALTIAAGRKGLDIAALNGPLPDPERLLPPADGEGDGDGDGLTPKEEAQRVVKPVQKFFFDKSGNPRLRKAAEVRAIADALNSLLDPHGWAVAPKHRS
ncbi:MAG: hypothetical protein KIS92_01060 [Planctomycetota bacterium]|nr:hypothetical protein [Planctomycetota bacterium]